MPHKTLVKNRLGNIDALILCGGQGKRLRAAVKNVPKPMAMIKGRPFLDMLIDYARGYGFKRVILCTGYKSRYIEQYYKKALPGIKVIFSKESRPLGTAGAVKNTGKLIRSSAFLVMNGDSVCAVDLAEFYCFHKSKQAMLSIALAKAAKDSQDCGRVILGRSGRIMGFAEKKMVKTRYVNAGIYFFDKAVLPLIPRGRKVSLEYDIFPLLAGRRLYGYPVNNKLTDIGTPERYIKAKKHL